MDKIPTGYQGLFEPAMIEVKNIGTKEQWDPCHLDWFSVTREGTSLRYAFVLVGCTSRSKRSPILPKVLSLEGREWHVLSVGESPANRYR